MPRKMASVKKANPSSPKPMPMTGPASFMNGGHKSPSSKERTVPETAPTANRIAAPLRPALGQQAIDRLARAQVQALGDRHQQR